MPYTVFVTARTLSPEGKALLDQEGCRTLFLEGAADAAEVLAVLERERVDAVISRTVDLSAAAIAACDSLKVVSKHGVGVSNIDVEACTERGIPVFSTPGANAQSVAEMALGLLLSAARGIAHMDGEIRAGRWTRLQNGLELKGRTMGLVGFGQVGRLVATFCQALGMRVLAYDPYAGAAGFPAGVERAAGLDALLGVANVLSLHIPLTPETRGLIGAEQLARLPAGSILVNTARGEVVDEQALIEALASGRLAAAGLDTTVDEPLALDSPLRGMSQVVLTPHVGGSTHAALAAMAVGAVRNVLGYLQHGTLDRDRVVNLKNLQQPDHGATNVR
ncbi:hydroxyacid dehydrogenase [Parapusillimonas granuli]|uniref:Hydroxyacid dehydrogenase n=1 Tax=Parapusillimonas granuli TaxID=380911 RepID=A0A853G3P6_9BURK|nr:hydroxyacid dehydrogenase [Parapusillimonas granuli]MBB5217279.1 D-3-phosphoglycerate dehydrogenase [Parapusillimonas granuli]MEB2399292.1 hydroxyacid dehydrogenase [Alcaligenaceae bacterium]NYT50929.1 hydroxyacid dehydrogenase [Parapusillimonas granuli]